MRWIQLRQGANLPTNPNTPAMPHIRSVPRHVYRLAPIRHAAPIRKLIDAMRAKDAPRASSTKPCPRASNRICRIWTSFNPKSAVRKITTSAGTAANDHRE